MSRLAHLSPRLNLERLVGCVESSKTHRSGNRKTVRPRRLDAPYNPRLEPLEDRTLMSTCHVTRLSDSGVGKSFRGDLRYCINKVNAEPGADAIDFTVTGTINLTGPLPDLGSDIDILGPGMNLLTVRRDSGGDYRVFSIAAADIVISGMAIEGGNADVGGGVYNQGTLTLENARVGSNTAFAGVGGGIYNAGILILAGTTVVDNTAISQDLGFGGGIYNESDALAIILDSSVVQNLGRSLCGGGGCPFNQTAGGGIYNAAGADLTIDRTTISENVLRTTSTPNLNHMFGVGIYNGGTASIANSSITLNEIDLSVGPKTKGHGGGVHNVGTATIVNSTIALNEMRVEGTGSQNSSAGGGLYNSAGVLTVNNSTVAFNMLRCIPSGASNRRGAGIAIDGGAVHTRNTLFGNNKASGGGCQPVNGPDINGALTSSDYSLFSNTQGGNGFGPNDILNVGPEIGDLDSNGGLTDTVALLPGSPAIDAGDNTDAPDFDQRGPGFPRIVNGTIDIGAFEVQSTPIPPTTQPRLDLLSLILATADLDSLT